MSEARRARRRRPLRAALLLLLAALMTFLLLNSKYSLTVTDYSLSYPSLPAEFDGFRIVQLSDLHGAEFGEGSSRLVAAVRAQSPDIIALTGDFLDEGKTDDELPRLRVLVSALSAIAPVYFVSRHHDWGLRRDRRPGGNSGGVRRRVSAQRVRGDMARRGPR